MQRSFFFCSFLHHSFSSCGLFCDDSEKVFVYAMPSTSLLIKVGKHPFVLLKLLPWCLYHGGFSLSSTGIYSLFVGWWHDDSDISQNLSSWELVFEQSLRAYSTCCGPLSPSPPFLPPILRKRKNSSLIAFLNHFGNRKKCSGEMAAPLVELGLCHHYNVGCPCRRACPLRPRYVEYQCLLYRIPTPVEEVADINNVFGEYIPPSTLFLEEYEEKRIAKSLRPDRFPVLSWSTKAFAGRTVEGESSYLTFSWMINSQRIQGDWNNSPDRGRGWTKPYALASTPRVRSVSVMQIPSEGRKEKR